MLINNRGRGLARRYGARPSARLAGAGVVAAASSIGKMAYNAYKYGSIYGKIKSNKAKNDKAKTISPTGQSIRLRRPMKIMGDKRKPTLKKLNKKVKDLQCLMNASAGELIYRSRVTGALTTSVNAQNAVNLATFYNSYYEGVLAQLRYYDPSTPSTLVTADGTTGTYSKDFCFTSNFARLTIRNNYQTPVSVSVWGVTCKTDTSIDPLTAWSNGTADMSNVSYTSVLSYPSDSDQIDRLWKIERSIKKQLNPGETMVVMHTTPKFDYDPAVADSQTETYRREHKAFAFLLAITGVLAHDTSVAERTRLAAGIDWELDRVSKVRYDAGANIKYVYCSNSSSASFTNGGVVSMQPISDNISYSVN